MRPPVHEALKQGCKTAPACRHRSHLVLEAIHDEILPGDEARLGCRQEHHKLGDVGRLSRAVERDAITRNLGPTADDDWILRQLGLDQAGADRVAAA